MVYIKPVQLFTQGKYIEYMVITDFRSTSSLYQKRIFAFFLRTLLII